MIKCENVNVIEGSETTILQDISFNIETGAVGVLLSLNDHAKDTLFKCISEQNNSYKGSIDKEGHVSYYKELPSVCNDLTGKEYLEMLLAMNPTVKNNDIWSLVDSLGISREITMNTKQVSIYTKRCLILLASLILDNDTILINEPFYGIDRASQRKLIDVINHLKERGKTILISTNIIRYGFEVGDDLLIMTRGKIKQIKNIFKSIKQFELNVMPMLIGQS